MIEKKVKKTIITSIMMMLVVVIAIVPLAVASIAWTPVSNFAELKAALADAKVTHILFTNDIHIERNGADINERKAELVIDADGYKITAHSSNSRNETLRLNKPGNLKEVTLQNAEVEVRNYFGLISVSESSKMSDVLLIFENIDFHGPQLVFAEDCSVTLRNSRFILAPGHNGTVDELVEATHIRLEGVIDIYKDAPGRDEVFRIERKDGGITIARDAVVNVSLNRGQRKSHKSGFIHMQKSGGYIIFEEDSYFSFEGNGFFQQHKDVRELTIGARAVVKIRTYGNFKGNYGIFMLRGDMVVEEGAIVDLIAMENTKKAPIIQCDKQMSSVTFNSPERVFIYNSSTHSKDRGSAIGLEGSKDSFDISYNGIRSLGYWEDNTMPPDNLNPPTYGWENLDNSAYSVSYRMSKDAVTNLRTINSNGLTRFTAKNTHLYSINVIYIGAGVPTYLVEFDANGGDPNPEPQYVNHGSLVTEPPEPVMQHMRLVGWYRNSAGTGAAWDFSADVVEENTTLYAKWAWAEFVTIRYLPGYFGEGEYVANPGVGSRYTFEDEATTSLFASGFYIESWNLRVDGLGQRYSIGEEITATENITLFAQWEPLGGGFSMDFGNYENDFDIIDEDSSEIEDTSESFDGADEGNEAFVDLDADDEVADDTVEAEE